MKGSAHAATRDYEMAITSAWHGEMLARQKKLKSLREYLPRSDSDDPPPAVQPDVILDAMLTMQAYGVPMNITKVGGE